MKEDWRGAPSLDVVQRQTSSLLEAVNALETNQLTRSAQMVTIGTKHCIVVVE
jgi:hypothetical protein